MIWISYKFKMPIHLNDELYNTQIENHILHLLV